MINPGKKRKWQAEGTEEWPKAGGRFNPWREATWLGETHVHKQLFPWKQPQSWGCRTQLKQKPRHLWLEKPENGIWGCQSSCTWRGEMLSHRGESPEVCTRNPSNPRQSLNCTVRLQGVLGEATVGRLMEIQFQLLPTRTARLWAQSDCPNPCTKRPLKLTA